MDVLTATVTLGAWLLLTAVLLAMGGNMALRFVSQVVLRTRRP